MLGNRRTSFTSSLKESSRNFSCVCCSVRGLTSEGEGLSHREARIWRRSESEWLSLKGSPVLIEFESFREQAFPF